MMNSETSVSAIVPARNEEATISAAVESLAAQPEIRDIIVVNDESTDGTAAVLRRLSAQFPQLRILETRNLPADWVGKNHAVWVGAEQATGEWLLFTDADGTCPARLHMRWPMPAPTRPVLCRTLPSRRCARGGKSR